MCSHPSAPSASAATVGPRREDLPVAGDLHARAEQRRPGGGALRADRRDRRRGDLRAGLAEPVGEAHRHPGRGRAAHERARHGTAAGQRAAQRGRRAQARVEQARERGGDEADQRHLLCAQRVEDALELEALVHDRGRGVDRRAHEDRQAADVDERQRAQPALARVQPERDGRAERAPQQVAVAQLHGLRRGGRARGVDHNGRGVEIVRAPGDTAGRRRALAERLIDQHRGTGHDLRALGGGQAQVDGDCDRPAAAGRRAAPGRSRGPPAARSPRAGRGRRRARRGARRRSTQPACSCAYVRLPAGVCSAVRSGAAAAARASHASTSMAHRLAFAPCPPPGTSSPRAARMPSPTSAMRSRAHPMRASRRSRSPVRRCATRFARAP